MEHCTYSGKCVHRKFRTDCKHYVKSNGLYSKQRWHQMDEGRRVHRIMERYYQCILENLNDNKISYMCQRKCVDRKWVTLWNTILATYELLEKYFKWRKKTVPGKWKTEGCPWDDTPEWKIVLWFTASRWTKKKMLKKVNINGQR